MNVLTIQKFYLFFILLKEVSSAQQGWIYLIKKYIFFFKYSTYSIFQITVLYLNTFQNSIYSCDAKLNFQHIYSGLQETFNIISVDVLLNIV